VRQRLRKSEQRPVLHGKPPGCSNVSSNVTRNDTGWLRCHLRPCVVQPTFRDGISRYTPNALHLASQEFLTGLAVCLHADFMLTDYGLLPGGPTKSDESAPGTWHEFHSHRMASALGRACDFSVVPD
jgi:hypothetical protein